MFPNAFIGHANEPTAAELAAVLGPAKPLWDQLLSDLATTHHLTLHEWNSYSPKYGCAFRVKLKKRNILYFVPGLGTFRTSFILGDKAIHAAREAKLSASLVKLLDGGTRYPEGTGIQFDIKGPKDLALASQLTALKLAH